MALSLVPVSVVALFLLIGVSGKQQYALNVPRVLLPLVPPSGIKSNFTITATHGCFSWTSTKPDVASVAPVQEIKGRSGCSKKAIVTAQSTQTDRLSSVIMAEEIGGGIVLRCDVFVDTIWRIEITTRTRELLLEEEPERFEVQAFDEEGNMFSTLSGQIFDWQLLVDEEATHQEAQPDEIVKFILFEDSTYSTKPAIRKLEAEGLQGDTVLVAGVSTGSAKVQAGLVDKIWKDVQASMVRLLVLENLMLQPCYDVYILPLSFVDYRVERRRHGKVEQVPVPSDQHSLQLSNETVAELDTPKSRVTGLVIGFTEVVLQDKNMLHMPTATKPSAGVHVVAPHHLSFTIAPDNVWVLETQQEYAITVHIFDKGNHKILPTENIALDTTLPLDYLTLHSSTPNGSYHHVTAARRGSAYLYSTLKHLKHPVTGELTELPAPITRKQLLEIYDPIGVEPRRLVLLWDPQSGHRYKHVLRAYGGSGTYTWSCDPEGVVGVAGNGTVQAIAKGSTLVFVADVKNTAHCNQTEVHVVPPAKMTFLPSVVEIQVGKILSLPLQILGYIDKDKSEMLPFTDCRQLQISITLTDSAIFNVSVERGDIVSVPEGACLVLKALALIPGSTRVIVNYSYGRSVSMEAVVTIAAYLPLVPVDPESIAIVALGTSKEFIFEGGPLPWVLDRSKFFNKMTPEDPAQVNITKRTPIRDLNQHIFRVLCLVLGEQELSVAVGNNITAKNQFPATETATSRILCAVPVSMTIHPVLTRILDCPLYTQESAQVHQFPVLCDETLELEVQVFDSESRPFDNFTSLDLRWETSDKTLFPLPHPLLLDHQGKRAILRVDVRQEPGTVVLKVTCNKYYTMPSGIHTKGVRKPNLRVTATLLLRTRPYPSPPNLLLFNHPENHALIAILHGSGHFQVNPVARAFHPAEIHYSPESQTISVVPFSSGKMEIAIRDLCLDIGDAVMVGVAVGMPYGVEVTVGDKVQVKNSTVACVQVVNSESLPFHVSQLRFMKLRPYPKTSHIRVYSTPLTNLDTPLSEDAYSVCYTVEGVAVGSTYLMFNVTSDDIVVASKPKEIQVFAPLKLNPPVITLLPGAIFQILSSGGPKPEITILYSISDEGVANVSNSGMVHALKVGSSTVTGRIKIPFPAPTQPSYSYSQDTIKVQVVKLTGVRIFLPTPRLLSGVDIAVYVVGLNGETPFAFGSCVPGLTFQWSVSNMDVLSLTSVYEGAGVSLQEEQDFDAVLHTRNPGQGVIKVIARCAPGLCEPNQAIFTDQIQVVVVPPLQLVRPLSGHFLLPHNGLAHIVTNRDGVTQLNYQLLQGPNGERTHVVTLGEQGEVRAAAVTGHAVVMVTESEEVYRLNQTLMVHVEVHPVASLSLSPLSLAQAMPNSRVHAFPLGYSAHFIAHLHDNVGRRFDYAEIGLSHRLNHYDTVIVSPESGNTTYLIKASKQGDAIMKVWMTSHPHIADYLRIRVGYAILPSLATVHLGSLVCFSTHLTEDKPGSWSVAEGGVLQLLPDTGVGRAVGVGRTVIYHKREGAVDTHTEITVAKVDEVILNASLETLGPFTNGPKQGGEEYGVPVQFLMTTRDEEGESSQQETFSPVHTSPSKECLKVTMGIETPPIIGSVYYIQQVPFECVPELRDKNGGDIGASKYLSAQATFDPLTGRSFCKLLPVESSMFVEALSIQDGLKLSLRVVAFDHARSYSVESQACNVPFEPAFHISRSEVLLSARDPSSEVVVTGLGRQLHVLQVNAPYPLSVVRSSRGLSPTKTNYLISLLPDYHCPPEPPFSDLNITFSSPLTHQEVLVAVTFLESDITCPSDDMEEGGVGDTPITGTRRDQPKIEPVPQGSFLYLLVIVLAIILAIIVICLALGKTNSNPNTGFSAHLPPGGVSSPHLPIMHSPPPQAPHIAAAVCMCPATINSSTRLVTVPSTNHIKPRPFLLLLPPLALGRPGHTNDQGSPLHQFNMAFSANSNTLTTIFYLKFKNGRKIMI